MLKPLSTFARIYISFVKILEISHLCKFFGTVAELILQIANLKHSEIGDSLSQTKISVKQKFEFSTIDVYRGKRVSLKSFLVSC